MEEKTMGTRYNINEIKNWEPVLLFGKKCIYTSERISSKSIPEGFYAYELRHYDDDWSLYCQIAKFILVNFGGTIVINEPLPVDLEVNEVYIRNGDEDLEPDENGDLPIDFEWIESFDEKAIEELEPFAGNWIEYTELFNNHDKSHFKVPDECVMQIPGTLYVKEFTDDTIDTLKDATDIFNKEWRHRIVIDIKDFDAKQINQIREIFYNVKNLYEEISSMYEQERLIFKCRPLKTDELDKRYKLKEEGKI